MSDAKKFAEHALKYVGYACNHFIDVMSDYGAIYGDAWCAWFTSTNARECGFTDIIPMTGGAGCFARQGVPYKMGTWHEGHNTKPKVGDIITFSWNGIGGYETCGQDKYYSDHVGIVYKVDNNYVYTVEGNANGSNTGSTVCTKVWKLYSGKINGYYRPNWKNVGNESEEEEMNFKKGDKSDGVFAYKSMLIQAQTLGLITQKVNADNVFGDGTLKATKQVQEKYKLEVDGIAGKKTITALNEAITKKIKQVYKSETMQEGDWNLGIASYKALCNIARELELIKATTDKKLGFGDGTAKATKQIQELIGEKPTGVATKYTIEKMRIITSNALDKLKDNTSKSYC